MIKHQSIPCNIGEHHHKRTHTHTHRPSANGSSSAGVEGRRQLLKATYVHYSPLTCVISKRQRITLRLLYAMSRPSVVCLSSVTLVHPTQAVELFGNLFSLYDSPGTLLFWCQKSLVGNAPFPLKFAFKVTHPLSNSEISTNIGS